MTNPLTRVRAAVQKAVPEIETRMFVVKGVPGRVVAPILLSDVLRAIEINGYKNYRTLHIRPGGAIGVISPVGPMTHVYVTWNLAETLDNQAPETIAFLDRLLATT